jgi:uncharacterized phage-like protein YoqJ
MSDKNKKNSCAFTGHREINNFEEYDTLEKCVKNLISCGVDTFYNGMAIGFDMLAAELVIKLREEFPQIKLIACIPCLGQEKNYSEKDKEKYAQILEKCDDIEVLSNNYYNGCMFARDRFMVDNSDYIVAHLRHTNGGTYYTVTYARLQNKEIIVV